MKRPETMGFLWAVILFGLAACTAPPPPTNTVPELCQSFGLVAGTPRFKACLIKEGREVTRIEASLRRGNAYARTIDTTFRYDIEKRRRYEYLATGKGQRKGTVRIALQVGSDGTVLSVRIFESSGNRLIDRTGLEMIALASPFPATLTAKPMTFVLTITMMTRNATIAVPKRWILSIGPVRPVLGLN